ncbi:hypothetical protein [Pseudohongiella nitratireducens]|uniref:hypothetical protein n=1 Tax=Pseudohongiella nitratireducens TaxID=1768907 RepID=UPI0030EF516A|tara:strand:+ start:4942 stop:5721 length:780 start_codon:yes stop_codon:yes gene_type:complete
MQPITAKHLFPLALIFSLTLIGSNVQGQQNQSASDDNNSAAANRAANLIVTLEHRSPVTALERLRPLLDPRGDIGRIADKLVINTTAGNLVELERALDAFDVPARRLVLSIDPSFSSSENIDDRQSMQALEFEMNTFVLALAGNAALPEGTTTDNAQVSATTNEGDLETTAQPAASLRIEAEITGSTVHADIQTFGIEALLPTYRVSMPLGQWVTLDPINTGAETTTALDNQTDQDNAQVPTQSLQQTADFAVRVDVLP